jgi:trans-aconitate 2-methyltransferase
VPTWNSDTYLEFANERTQPAVDLAARVAVESPKVVVDLGCGPGNSTAIAARRWPTARIVGIDNSPAMLAAARRDFPEWQWHESDITSWAQPGAAAEQAGSLDVLFSNAALQWVPKHETLIPQLFDRVATGGALAFQVPHNLEAPPQRHLRALAASTEWRNRFTKTPISWHVEPASFYYDTLAPRSKRVDMWFAEYAHILSGPEGVVEWYRGTGLRPFLDALPDESSREAFVRDYLVALTPDYPRRADEKILMFFRRLFVIAYR